MSAEKVRERKEIWRKISPAHQDQTQLANWQALLPIRGVGCRGGGRGRSGVPPGSRRRLADRRGSPSGPQAVLGMDRLRPGLRRGPDGGKLEPDERLQISYRVVEAPRWNVDFDDPVIRLALLELLRLLV